MARRRYHTGVATKDAVLLIGGKDSGHTTEWIYVNGSAAQGGPFAVRHGQDHCTVKISADAVIVTGGWLTENYVTLYSLAEESEHPLSPLGQPRWGHACSVYQDTTGQQVSKMALQLQTKFNPIWSLGPFL